MTLTIYTGLPGAGKSKALIGAVKEARASGRIAVTFANSDAPLLNRASIKKNHRIASRIPGLSCELDHFVPPEKCVEILAELSKGTLVAFEEAQYWDANFAQHWHDATIRGLDVIVAMPSPSQLLRLQALGYKETQLTLKCQHCDAASATTFLSFAEENRTETLCESCQDEKTTTARLEIVAALKKNRPYPDEEALYQPVPFSECRNWRVLRPDSKRRMKEITRIIQQSGVFEKANERTPTYIDIGCNTGYFCYQMRQLGFLSTGVDTAKEDIRVARQMTTYFRRDYSTYIHADAYDYLKTTQEQTFDVVSAFSVIQWVMIQRSPEHGLESLKHLFNKATQLCILELGNSSEAHYVERIGIKFDKKWVGDYMETHGNFRKIHCLDSKRFGLKRDVFIGEK